MGFPDHRIVRSRLARNRLLPGTELAGAGEVVTAACGIQAQELPSARLAIRARSAGLTDAAVEQARLSERSFLRTWAMRGTLHLVPSEDLEWLRRLLSPAIIRSVGRRSAQLGLDEQAYRRAMNIIESALSGGGELSRKEIVAELAGRGVDAVDQRAPHLLLRASVEGLICEGPMRSGKPTYVLVDEWLGRRPAYTGDREACLVRLVSRYLGAYGPAGPEDLACWSGLAITECREAFRHAAGGMTEVSIAGRRAWANETAGDESGSAPAGLRLLPAFDTFLLGYRNRDLHLDPKFARRVNAGGGIVKPVVLIDGVVEGVWKITRTPRAVGIRVRPFRSLRKSRKAELEAEVQDVGRFLDRPAVLTLEPTGPAAWTSSQAGAATRRHPRR